MRIAWFILASALLFTACSRNSEPPTVMVGIDGAEWQIIDEMIADGELPNFAKIKQEGAWGHLINNGMETSPVVWTTFATGRFARTHGILDHVFPFGGTGARRPVTSELRQVPALWNIATHYGLRSIVIGYFVSHPPEPIDGVMVSSQAASWKEGAIYPDDALDLDEWRYQKLHNQADRKREWATYFGWDYDPAQADDPDSPYKVAAATIRERNLEWRIIKDEFLRLATRDLAQEPSDLFITYYRLPDMLSHSLWKFYDPGAYENPPTDLEMELFGNSVKESYRFVDRALGELLAAWEGKANMVIVSDHGFGRAASSKMEDEDARVQYLTGDHRPDGIIMAYGPDIQPGQIEGLTIMEIAPTMAALLGIPVAGDLPGQVAMDLIRPAFFERKPLTSVADYSGVEMINQAFELDHDVQEEEMNTLRGLGYVGEGVEFDVGSVAGEYNFWEADDHLVTNHVSSEVFYYLLQGDAAAAEDTFTMLINRRPDLEYDAFFYIRSKFLILMDHLPEGTLVTEPFQAFFDKHGAKY